MRTLYSGGTIVTNIAALPITDAIAVANGRIVALGHEARAWSASWDDVVDLSGRCLLPGFRDGHAHPLSAGIEQISLNLVTTRSIDEVLDAVQQCAAEHPDESWIRGAGYQLSLLPDGVGDAELLDRVCPDRPVALTSNDHHCMWVNTRALELAGIDRLTPDPPGGTIVRRGDGTPIGTLREFGAIELIELVLPEPDPQHVARGLHAALGELARHGIVWAQDALVTPDSLEVYAEAARNQELSCRFNGAFRAEPTRWVRQRDDFLAARHALHADGHASRSLTAFTVKFFADGVIESGTGFLLEPYEDAPHSCGLPNWTTAELSEAVRRFDADGFQTHIHAIGDAGVRMALDAIEHASRHNGPRDRRPVIAHTELVHPDDRGRFSSLGVIANFEPLWACLDQLNIELIAPRLGPRRTAMQYPIASLAKAGATISFGSDWPVSSLDPLAGLAVAVSRQNGRGEPINGWIPEEKLPILASIAAYTSGTAYQAFSENDSGSLAVRMTMACDRSRSVSSWMRSAS